MWSLNLDIEMDRNISKREYKINWEALTWITIAAGVGIRVFHFFVNRSLWLDEIYLSAGLLRMDLFQLATSPLDYQQQAPVGFLFLVKTCLLVFGESEMALRLVPLLSGIAALFFFLPVARCILNQQGVFIATSLFAFAPLIIYHSVEIKQYSSTLLATVIALFLYVRYHTRHDALSRIKWAVCGAVIIWFAYSSIFVFAGIAAAVCLKHIYRKNWNTLGKSVIVFSFWMISFVAYFFTYLRSAGESEWLINWFSSRNSFMPLPPTLETLKWLGFQFYRFLEYPLGLLLNWPDGTFDNFLVRNFMRMPLLPAFFFIIGTWALLRDRKTICMVLFFPIVLVVVASGLQLYPVYERLTVFIAPLVILVLAKGTEVTINLKWTYRFRLVLVALLLFVPVINSAAQLIAPEKMGGYKNTRYRQALQYINSNYQPGDMVYVYWNFVPAYRVYKQMGYLDYEAIEGRNVRAISSDTLTYFKNLEPDFKRLTGNRRVWLIYDNNLTFDIGDTDDQSWYQRGGKPGKRIFNKFNAAGVLKESFITDQVSAHLFELPAGSQ